MTVQTQPQTRSWVWAIAVFCGAIAASADVTVNLGQGQGWPQGNAQVTATLSGSPAPAALEIRFQFDSNVLDLTNVDPAASVSAAGKSLSWEESPPGRAKIVIVGVNTQTIANGPLAVMQFTVKAAATVGSNLALSGDNLSASGANGATLQTDLQNGNISVVACSQPAAPGGVDASDGTHVDRVRITWNPVTTTSEYVVYRSANGNTQDAQAIGTVTATQFDDLTAEAASAGGGCAPGTVFKTYTYWVKAKAPCGQSAFSASDTGFKGLVKLAAKREGAENLAPPLLNGVGHPVAIPPMEPSTDTATVTIPVPDDTAVDTLTLHYLDPATGWWYPAEAVVGLLALPPTAETENGQTVLRAVVRHGGFVQLAWNAPAVASVGWPAENAGMALVALSVVLVTSVARQRRRKPMG